jgi:hypothetical protein
MLAYVFWHAPAEGVDVGGYERSLVTFHRSLERAPPFGFTGSAAFRIGAAPWRASAGTVDAGAGAGSSYEDWYLVEDFAALGILNEAAVGRGHRTSHDRAAKGAGAGTAGIYRLIEGEVSNARAIAECEHATWVTPAPGAKHRELGAMLGDGIEGDRASLWQRQLVLGPAPEFCVLSRVDPAGVAPTRLAAQWSATTRSRAALFGA